jgi:hypothetical protein
VVDVPPPEGIHEVDYVMPYVLTILSILGIMETGTMQEVSS